MRPFDDRVYRHPLTGNAVGDTPHLVLPTFWNLDTKGGYLSGVDNLPAALTIPGNGKTVLPTFRYRLGDADATNLTAWGYGETLTAQGSGGTFNAGSPFHGTSDDSYDAAGTRYYLGPDATYGDITTEDFVLELVARVPTSGATERVIYKYDGAGLIFRWTGSVTMGCFIKDDGGTSVTVGTGAVSGGEWVHIMYFFDRSGSACGYTNATAGTPSVISAASGSISASTVAGFFATEGGANVATAPAAYLALWKGTNLLDSHLQQALVNERFQRLCGSRPRRAVGTKTWTSYTRATTAVVDNVEYGSELLPSTDPTSGWTETRASSALDTSVSHPEGAAVYAVSEDGTAGATHFLDENASGATAGTEYEFSLDIKSGNRDWSRLGFSAGASGWTSNDLAYFDTGNGVVGITSGDTIVSNIESIGNGWYRCRLRALADANGSATVLVNVAESNNDASFDGLDQISLYIANPTLRTWESKLYTLGAGMPRMAYRQEATSGADFKGMLSETAATNLITYSHEFDNAAWAKSRMSITANSVVAPDGTTTGDTLVEDGTAANTHYMSTQYGSAAGTFTASVYAKASNRTWLAVQFWSSTDGSDTAYFDLSTGSKGSISASIDAWDIEPVGNGWFRCWAKATRATAEAQYILILAAEQDLDVTFDGLSQDSLYLWAAQVEASVDYPTSIIATSGATSTRNADVLYFKGDDGSIQNNQQGTMECDALIPNHSTSAITGIGCALNDGGSTNDRMDTLLHSTDQMVSYIVTGGSVEKSTANPVPIDISDGDAHSLRTRWKADSVTDRVDTTDGTADTNASIPDDLDRILHGTSSVSSRESNALIRDIKIWPYPTTKKGT